MADGKISTHFLLCCYRKFHDDKSELKEEWHQSEGGFLKPIIFGGLDGILTSFAIVAGSAGGSSSRSGTGPRAPGATSTPCRASPSTAGTNGEGRGHLHFPIASADGGCDGSAGGSAGTPPAEAEE